VWCLQDRPLVGQDLVLWHTVGVTHIPRTEVRCRGTHCLALYYSCAGSALRCTVYLRSPHCSMSMLTDAIVPLKLNVRSAGFPGHAL